MKSFFAAIALAFALAAGGAAQAASGPALQQSWSFAGIFGTYDQNQLQRGFQVYREVCANCHGARLLSFRNLSESGGPGYSADQVRALAAEYVVLDPEAEGGERPGVPADRWPNPFPTEQMARDANNGAFPVDFSVIAKARAIHQDFPWWVFNYFTAYQEGGPDYIYSMLVSYTDPPPGEEVGEGQSYNAFLGHGISMAQPFEDGSIAYEGEGVPETVEQYAYDVSAFLMWVAEPHLAERKAIGFRVLIFLVAFAVLMFLVKQKLWARVKGHPGGDKATQDG